MTFGIPPFSMATKENCYYKIFFKDPEYLKYFFRHHPATKEAYLNGKLDMDLIDMIATMLDSNPLNRPQSIEAVRGLPYFAKSGFNKSEALEELQTRLRDIST
jgi:hypothetical protein